MEYALVTENLTRRYGRFTALRDLSMHVPKGAIYGFVGKNGAGKTTLIRLICGLQTPTSGGYSLYGNAHDGKGIVAARRKMGAVVETPAFYPGMTAAGNLREQFRFLGLSSFDGVAPLLKLVGLENTGRKKARQFSMGMKQRLGIAMALAGEPDFLVLDEPINGLDPQGIIEMRALLTRLNREKGVTVLISSHILDELSRLATHYGFIDGGRIVREMSAEALEAACRKSMRVETTDGRALSRVLTDMNADYEMITDTGADVYSGVGITKLALALDKEGCEIRSIQEREESLEGYFMSLVGGETNA